MRDIVNVFKALSDPTRIRIIKLLQKRPMCVCELTSILGVGQPTVSHHLRILRDAGVLDSIRNGLWVEYEISKEKHNKYAADLLKLISKWLNDDPRIIEDLKIAKKTTKRGILYKNKRGSVNF